MSVCAAVFAVKEINLLSDTLKCLFSHLNSPWPAAHSLCQSWDNPHRESRLVTITRRQSLEGRESSSSLLSWPTPGWSALRPLRPRVPAQRRVWLSNELLRRDSRAMGSRLSEVLFRLKRTFECSGLAECCPWCWSWRQQSCRCPRSWKPWKENLRRIEHKHLIEPWTLGGHASWYLLVFFRFYRQLSFKWPCRNDFSLGSRWRSRTFILATLPADMLFKIHQLGVFVGHKNTENTQQMLMDFLAFFKYGEVFWLFSHVAALQSIWQTGIQFDGLWVTLISCHLAESQSVTRLSFLR